MFPSVHDSVSTSLMCFGFVVYFSDTFSRPGGSSSPDDSQNNGWFRMFTVEAYKPYFDVDTSDVLERIRESLFPFKGSFQEKTAENPDL